MKQAKQRVVAIDYFRGVCILIILLSHSRNITAPFAYLSGIGLLWSSSAEFFFLVSGITFGLVRGPTVLGGFKHVLLKSWRRALILYGLYILTALGTIVLYKMLPPDSLPSFFGGVPNLGWVGLVWSVLSLRLMFGLADFLAFYAVYLVLAPFILYAVYRFKRAWWGVLALSLGLFLATGSWPLTFVPYLKHYSFAIWQLYFVLGVAIMRFQAKFTKAYNSLSNEARAVIYKTVIWAAAAVLAMSVAIGFNNSLLPVAKSLSKNGILPNTLENVYVWLVNHKPIFDNLLMNNRTGLLRPLVTLLLALCAYLLYIRYEKNLLKYGGRFIIDMGKDTLWIFILQAFIIPTLAALYLPRGLLVSAAMTIMLVGGMWLFTQRQRLAVWLENYEEELRESYYQAKYNAMYSR